MTATVTPSPYPVNADQRAALLARAEKGDYFRPFEVLALLDAMARDRHAINKLAADLNLSRLNEVRLRRQAENVFDALGTVRHAFDEQDAPEGLKKLEEAILEAYNLANPDLP